MESNQVTRISSLVSVEVSSMALLAAISCVRKSERDMAKTDLGLTGICVHCVDTTLRVVASDGSRIFVHAREQREGEEWPEWLAHGVIVPVEDLKLRLALIGDQARLSYAVDAPFIVLSDPADSCLFRLTPVWSFYPNYQQAIANLKAFEAYTVEEMSSTAFSSKAVKAAGDLAKILKSDLIRVHAIPANGPTLITFPSSPGSMLIQYANTSAPPYLGSASVKVLSGPLKGTLAALRAHKTRWERKSGRNARQKVAEYEAKIAALVQGLEGPALPAPEPEPEPEIDVEAIPEDSLEAARAKLSNQERAIAMFDFVSTIFAVLEQREGLSLTELADGAPIEDWFNQGLTGADAATLAMDWRRIDSVLPPDEIQPGEGGKPIGLRKSPAAPQSKPKPAPKTAKRRPRPAAE